MKSKEPAIWMMLLGLAGWWGWLPAAVVGWALACRLICLWLHWHQPARPCQTKEKATNPTTEHTEIAEKVKNQPPVYKAAVDQLADSMAAGAWQDGPAPKDGSWILGLFHGLPYVVGYDSWEVGGEMLPDGTGSPPDGHESGWCLAGDSLQVMDKDEPEKWARIIHPDRHMPASWDGPGDLG